MKDCNKILRLLLEVIVFFSDIILPIICGRMSLLKSKDMYSVNAFADGGFSGHECLYPATEKFQVLG